MTKSIFITGAASGIGKATATLFAQKGWFVGLFDINEEALKSLQIQIGEDKSCIHYLDVTQPESVKTALEYFGTETQQKMDILFNNAGVLHMGSFEEISLEKHRQILEVNIFGVINCTHQALTFLKNTPQSQVINMSSASAMYGIPEFASYSASKHAVRALTEALSLEFEQHQIKVSDIMPSFVSTPMVHDAKTKGISLQKAKTMLSAEEIAQTIWKAHTRYKTHWKLPKSLAIASKVLGIIPGAMRWFVKKSAM
jgi:NADP-dependent 3-hydroxy acid dehydrogenase YdfG